MSQTDARDGAPRVRILRLRALVVVVWLVVSVFMVSTYSWRAYEAPRQIGHHAASRTLPDENG
jgi:hypothetical protein